MKKSLFFCLLIWVNVTAFSQEIVKVMHYNLLQYGAPLCPDGVTTPVVLSQKNTWLKTIMLAYQPDIFTVNEMRKDIGYANNIRVNVLSFYNSAMSITTFGNSSGSDIVNTLFYNSNKFGYLKHYAITGNVRDIDVYKLYHKNSTVAGDSTFLWGFVAHLKAGSASTDVSQRTAAAQDVMTWLNAHPEVDNYFISGDFNLYTSSEGAYQAFLNPNDTRRFYDVTGQTTGWSGSNYKNYHTQSPRVSANNCGTTGGMDNRFDFILVNNAILNNANGVKYVANSYKAYGNDGVSYDVALNCAATTSVSATVCTALQEMSDHLPVVMELEFPTIVGTEQALQKTMGVEMQVLGNPVEEELALNFSYFSTKSTTYQLSITNTLGQVFHTQTLIAMENGQRLNFSWQTYPSGLYFIHLTDEKGNHLTKKVLKR
ncbi:MAG: T9SS type A sorting domain-containing protein [Bacteroidia bacterium]